MKHILIALTLFVAAPVSAQSLKLPTTVFLASVAADWSSTGYALSHNPNCHEINPLINWIEPHSLTVMVATGAISDVMVLYASHRLLAPRHPRLMRIALYSLSGFRVSLALYNARQAHKPH